MWISHRRKSILVYKYNWKITVAQIKFESVVILIVEELYRFCVIKT
jgi:hypothetical protein